MPEKRRIEIFSAGCPLCTEAVEQVRNISCLSCEITVLDTNDPAVAARARDLGVKSVPAVAIDGKLARCCGDRGIDLEELKKNCTGASPS
jgi:predicted thioredoxin/glutaredoxin